MRQCPDRDAFRAGRNLPDKEFRYLRTVIVTAAVNRGFGSTLAHLPLTFRHWAGITPYTSPCGLSRELWFCYPVARAWTLRPLRAPPASGFTLLRYPFFRRYGVNLPSSLTRDHSSALVSSTCLPVSVCGTGTADLPSRHFSTAQAPRNWVNPKMDPLHHLSVNEASIWFLPLPTGLNGAHLAAASTPQRPALVKRSVSGTGISTRCPSPLALPTA